VALDGSRAISAPLRCASTRRYVIVPGVKMDEPAQPEVMRARETQILGALEAMGIDDASSCCRERIPSGLSSRIGSLVAFRTYMTGELYGLLRRSGTLSQLMEGDEPTMPHSARASLARKSSEAPSCCTVYSA